ncbi:conserved hypothetical protein [Ricinus communis]|uniref:Uncharacterized protein n=1 Tax=Ricinus communis TaxID=3988 RepID=B9SQ72_RICCO|nr:conserved hypothetical protein [Ricinus communis]
MAFRRGYHISDVASRRHVNRGSVGFLPRNANDQKVCRYGIAWIGHQGSLGQKLYLREML